MDMIHLPPLTSRRDYKLPFLKKNLLEVRGCGMPSSEPQGNGSSTPDYKLPFLKKNLLEVRGCGMPSSEPQGNGSSTPSDLEISDDFGAFWRYLEQAPEMTIELNHRSILEEDSRSEARRKPVDKS
ncbi:hypothetical protein F2Q69_00022833 [Brassica cretica]|uniref:Uncharacterized protein n=1 Tax=Brassica cretica TaxID=69181 RepID=A0A8S9Q948_BRACR|nr:hypothetical protein F2Q69_00022833 [Brassica cretica]